MKVLLINGSPHQHGCTYTALKEIETVLNDNDVDTDWVWIGTNPIRGCIDCKKCKTMGKCIFDDDICNQTITKLIDADGVIIGSPVYYAGINGTLCSLLDRVFYASSKLFKGKIGAGIVSCRRSGSTASFDRINKYFSISKMPIVTSQYWNAVHGNTPDEVKQDLEGLQTMRTLATNMIWLLNCVKNKPLPELEEPIQTNFIR